MAGVAQSHIHGRFAWQAWHLVTSTLISRGTNSQPPSFCVAGVALMVLGGALGFGLGARDAQRGKRRPKQTLQRIVLPPPEPQLQLVSEVFADNISSMHTTQPKLQLVSQVKLVICMQRCGHRIISCCSDRFGPTWKETTGAA